MRPQGRHRAGPGGPRRHPALVVSAAVLAVTAMMGVTGTGFLHQLRAFDAPYSPNGTQAPLGFAAPLTPEGHGEDSAWESVSGNPLTTVHITDTVDCDLPMLPAGTITPSQLQTHLEGATACLDSMWKPRIEAAGYTFTPVTIRVYDSASDLGTACGEPEAAVPGVYCAVDRTIYLPSTLAERGGELAGWSELRTMGILAHEYGHHLQELTGILDASLGLHPVSKDPHEVTRRIESMATCLGALSQGRMTGAQQVTLGYFDHATDPSTYRADSDHGRAETQSTWAQRGFASDGDAGRCATFSAPADQVA